MNEEKIPRASAFIRIPRLDEEGSGGLRAFTVRIPEALHSELRAWAFRDRASMNEVVARAIAGELEAARGSAPGLEGLAGELLAFSRASDGQPREQYERHVKGILARVFREGMAAGAQKAAPPVTPARLRDLARKWIAQAHHPMRSKAPAEREILERCAQDLLEAVREWCA
jgi:hypothetical protein